jgi:threonine/homoserine/homoserine lactone efflux protein
MILKGFRFGMLLQIAVGPVCVFIFQTAITSGFITAESGVLAVIFVDALYILLAILGIGALLERSSGIKKFLKYFGATVLVIFGLSNILGALGISILPSLNLAVENQSGNVFSKVLLLTLSNPLTILFWAGVFSTRLIEDDLDEQEIYAFGTGAVLATAFFLTLIAFLGSLINTFINESFINILNGIVGIALVIFGIKTVLKEI